MHPRFIALLIAAGTALLIGAAPSTDTTDPSTGPSTDSSTTQSAEAASPKSALKAYNLAMAGGDFATMISLQHAVTDDEKHVARCSSQSDLQIAALEQAARMKFGDDSAKQMAIAVDDLDDAAIDAGHETFTDNRASVTFAEGLPIPMIRSRARWAIDIGAMLKAFQGTPDEFCDGVIRRGSAAKVTAQEITAGQFPTAAAAVEALKSRLKES